MCIIFAFIISKQCEKISRRKETFLLLFSERVLQILLCQTSSLELSSWINLVLGLQTCISTCDSEKRHDNLQSICISKT